MAEQNMGLDAARVLDVLYNVLAAVNAVPDTVWMPSIGEPSETAADYLRAEIDRIEAGCSLEDAQKLLFGVPDELVPMSRSKAFRQLVQEGFPVSVEAIESKVHPRVEDFTAQAVQAGLLVPIGKRDNGELDYVPQVSKAGLARFAAIVKGAA